MDENNKELICYINLSKTRSIHFLQTVPPNYQKYDNKKFSKTHDSTSSRLAVHFNWGVSFVCNAAAAGGGDFSHPYIQCWD